MFIVFIAVCLPCTTTAESQTSKNIKSIRLITDPWPPFYGPTLPKNGFFCEIVRQAFREVGYQLEVKFTDWKTAKTLSKKGEYDGLLGAYYNKKRAQKYTYSLPVISVKTIFIAQKSVNAKYNGDLNNLKNLRIGVSRGYIYTSEFDTATYLNKIEASGPKELINFLFLKKTDVILISEQVARYLLLQQTRTIRQTLTTLSPSLTQNKLFVLITQKNPDHHKIVSDFNQGLKKLVFSGKMASLLP